MADLTTTIAIASTPDDDDLTLLERVLEESEFWTCLARSRHRSCKEKADYQIVIMPDVDCIGREIASHTDPRLVERLVDLLHAAGWPRVTIGVASDAIFRPFGNRDAFTLADAAGYRFVTDLGAAYVVEDLAGRWTASVPEPQFGMNSAQISAPWLEADFRICFPKVRSDPDSGYRLALSSLARLVSFPSGSPSMGDTRPEDRVRYLLGAAGPQFVILDGWTCCLGPDGTLRPVPSTERTLIAGADPVIVDWVAATKMGVAPTSSPIFRATAVPAGMSQSIRVVGSVAPFAALPDRNSWLESETTPIAGDAFATLGRLLASKVDLDMFPLDDLILGDVARRLGRAVSATPGAGLATFLRGLGQLLDRLAFLHARVADTSELVRRHFPVNLSIDAIGPAQFERLADRAKELSRRLESSPDDARAFGVEETRDGEFIAVYRKSLAIDFSDFLAQFDVARSMSYLNGYVGGAAIPLAVDERGRIERQLERAVYLSQPPFLSWWGRDSFDVTKIEQIDRSPDAEVISWHTLASENRSAEADDGIVAIRRGADGLLAVEIVVRQKFPAPAALRFMETQQFAQLRLAIAREGYRTFMENTVANFEAAYEGRDPLLGRPPDSQDSGSAVEILRRFFDRHAPSFAHAASRLRGMTPKWRPATHGGSPGEYDESLDERGFRHFRPAGANGTAPRSPDGGPSQP